MIIRMNIKIKTDYIECIKSCKIGQVGYVGEVVVDFFSHMHIAVSGLLCSLSHLSNQSNFATLSSSPCRLFPCVGGCITGCVTGVTLMRLLSSNVFSPSTASSLGFLRKVPSLKHNISSATSGSRRHDSRAEPPLACHLPVPSWAVFTRCPHSHHPLFHPHRHPPHREESSSSYCGWICVSLCSACTSFDQEAVWSSWRPLKHKCLFSFAVRTWDSQCQSKLWLCPAPQTGHTPHAPSCWLQQGLAAPCLMAGVGEPFFPPLIRHLALLFISRVISTNTELPCRALKPHLDLWIIWSYRLENNALWQPVHT